MKNPIIHASHMTAEALEQKERREMDRDPLAKLNRKLTASLDNFFSMSAEDDDSYAVRRDPEYQAVERFLSHA